MSDSAEALMGDSVQALVVRENGLSLLLPWPPSVNALYRAIRGKNILNARYRDWIKEAKAALAVQPHFPFACPVNVGLIFCPPTDRVYDPDNFCKAVLDFIVERGIIRGDSNRDIKKLTLEVGEGFNGVWVDIWPVIEGSLL